MSDEIPTVYIRGDDRRPPASRMSRRAEGTYDDVLRFDQRKERPVFTTPVNPRPGRTVVLTQPFHQRVRIHWREFLGV